MIKPSASETALATTDRRYTQLDYFETIGTVTPRSGGNTDLPGRPEPKGAYWSNFKARAWAMACVRLWTANLL